jgi:hypothetical protein
MEPALPKQIFPLVFKIVEPMGEVVDELARFGRLIIVPRVEAPSALSFFSHELTGPFDLGIKRREWRRVHGIAARVHSLVRDCRASLSSS